MNYTGRFLSEASDGESVHFDFDSLGDHGHAGTFKVPDAHLLFSGDLERSGSDLIISDHLNRVIVPNYFHGDKRPLLVSPEGAPLDPKVIDALTGHNQYAQAAGTNAAGKVVGHIAKMTGSASLVRNGVTIDLNSGDAVYQTDVVQTGSNSTLGLVLIDGTTFNLSANARLMLNDLTYDPASTSNTSLYTLVQGAASFVAGQVAKTGDMKVGTPVGTVGIRGTAVILDISSVDGKVSISVVDQEDGQTHAVQVFDSAGILIGTVTSNGATLTLTPIANFQVIAQEVNKTPAQISQEFSTFQGVLSTYDYFKAIAPDTPPPSDGKRGDANPQSTTKYAANSITPTYSAPVFNAAVGGNVTNPQTSGAADVPTTSTTSQSSATHASTSTNSQSSPNILFVEPQPTPVQIPFVVSPSTVTLISASGNDHFGPVMSADGRFVTYDPDGGIYLFDRISATTSTIASAGGGFTYSAPSISADGNYIVYQGSNGTQSFVFIYDNNPADAQYQQTSELVAGSSPVISGNGSEIVVENGGTSIGVYDVHGHAIANITPAAIGVSGTLWKPAVSADGNLIAFWSSNSTTAGGAGQLLTYNLSTGTVTTIANTASGAGMSAASISADGTFVVFQSDAPNLFGSQGAHATEIFLYDLATGQIVFSTANAAGASYNPVISPDGHFIIFSSTAQFTSDNTNGVAEVYVVNVTDPANPVYQLVSASADGAPANGASDLGASISAGGLFVSFGSNASNLTTTGTSGGIFFVDSSSGRTAVIPESTSSPSQLSASGVIQITGGDSSEHLNVSQDPSTIGSLNAVIGTDGNIHWTYQAAQSAFASLTSGQLSDENFVITLVSSAGSTAIPIQISVYDANQPSIVVPPTVTISGSGGLTNHATQAVSGVVTATEAAVGATVTLYDTINGTTTAVGTASVGIDGNWSTAVTLSGDGAHSIVAQDTDAAGHTGTSAPVTFTLATAAPTIAITTPIAGDNIINKSEAAAGVTITGTATAGSAAVNGQTATITIVDGSNVVEDTYATTVTGGTWSVNVAAAQAQALADGSYSITANVADAAGNAATTAMQSITVDESVPTIAITSPIAGNNIINKSEAAAGVTISGTATAGSGGAAVNGQTATITILDGSNVVKDTYTTLVTGGAWSVNVTAAQAQALADGIYSINASVSDTAGNPTIATQSVTVAESGPAVTIALVDGNNVINAAEAHAGVALNGTVSGLAQGATFNVSVTDGSFNKSYTATVGTGGTWSATIPSADATTLANGTATVSAQVTDANGNQSTIATQSVTVAESGPAVTIALVDGNNVINAAEAHAGVALGGTVSGIAQGATFNVSVTDGSFNKSYTATVGTGGTWSATIPSADATTLANGTATVSAQVTDANGNQSTIATQSVTVAESGPAVTIALVDGNNVINAAEAHAGVALGGTVSGIAQGATFNVSVTDGSFNKSYTATVGTGGTWTATIPSADAVTLANGTATVSAQVTDVNGNQSAVASQSVTVAESGPTVTIALVDGNNIINAAEAHAGVALGGTVSGIAQGATFNVSVTDGSFNKSYTATVGTGGTWSATIPSADAVTLANGTATVSAQVTDANGNQSTIATQSVTVAESGPAVTIALVDGNNVINAAEAHAGVALNGTVSGIAQGATFNVSVTDGSFNKSYTATVGTGGTWSATIPSADATTLANGTATVSAQVTDANGNQSTIATQSVTVAESGPAVTIALVDGNNVINAAEAHAGVALGGTVSGIAQGATFNVSVTDGSFNKSYTATVGTGGTWSATIPSADATTLANGTATVSAQVTDANGNQSTIATQSVTVAESGPAVTIALVDGNNVINAAEAHAGVALGGTVSGIAQGATFNVSVTDGSFNKSYTATVGTGGTWSATIPSADATTLANGTATVSAQVTDANGNQSTIATQSVTVAESGPAIGITTPIAGDNIINKSEAAAGVTISGAATAGSAAVNGQTATITIVNSSNVVQDTFMTAVAASAWSVNLTAAQAQALADGSYSIKANVSDAAGNAATTATQAITLDTLPPTVTISTAGTTTNQATQTISGTVATTEAAVGATVTLYDTLNGVTTQIGTAPVVGGTWLTSVVLSGYGAHSIVAQDTDAAGNTGASTPAVFTLALETIPSGGTLSIGGVPSVTVDFEGTGGDLVLVSPGITGTISAVSTATGSVTITGNGAVTTSSGDAIDLTALGGSLSNPASLGIVLSGAITGASAGIDVIQNAYGDIVITTGGPVIGLAGRGILAEESSTGDGNILVDGTGDVTGTGDNGSSSGILAENLNSANGGNVVVSQTGNVVGGTDGIRAFTNGNGNVAVTTAASKNISGADGFGVEAASFGTGSVSITTVAGDIIDSGSAGVQAVNLATAIAVGAASSVSVTAYGTINSGANLLSEGSQPQGISAGYDPGILDVSNTSVNGTVSVFNFANVTASAGWGIDAFNWGNGSVTLTDEASTTVSGAQYGIGAYSLSTGSGSVTINVGVGATISAGGLYGLTGIQASEKNAGDISITTSTGDVINSGGTGIGAGNQATSASSASQISVTTFGTINSGFDAGNGEPGGIWAGYTPGDVQAVNTNVAGNVIVDNSATINAASGTGIGLYNWGIGNLTVILETSSVITAPVTGVTAYAQGGGNVSITNHGTILITTGVGISAGTGNGVANSVSGVVSINNTGLIVGLGSLTSPVIQINNDSTQAAIFTNSGTVTAQQLSTSSSNLAVAAYTGSITINNTGNISGNVGLATAIFNNNSGGIWNVGGSNSFGQNANAINNIGTINIADASFFTASGTLAFNNANAVNVLADSYAYIGAAVSGNGTFSIGDRSQLEFASSVAAGQTVSFVDNNGLLTLDSPSTFNGTIAGLTIGDSIDFFGGISVASAAISGSTLTVTETNNQTLTYQIAGALSGAKVAVVSANEIQLVPTAATPLTGASGPLSFTPSTGQFYILSNETISGTGGVGFNVASTDSTGGDYLTVEINQPSSISGLSGSFNGINLTTTGANIALINSGTITSAGGRGINTNSGTGSTDIIDNGNVSGATYGIEANTGGSGPLNIVVGSGITVTGTSQNGIFANSTLGVVEISTSPGDTVNSGSIGIFALNQGSTVPQANNSAISISTAGTINSGSNPTGNGNEPGGVSAGYRGTTGTATPTTTVFGNINVNNDANINASAGFGISAFIYGVGNISVSVDPGETITATAAGTTTAGFAQYGIVVDNYESGDISIVAAAGSTINSGSTGIDANNHATAILASAASSVTVVANGAISSGLNTSNPGNAPAGIVASFDSNSAGAFNANVNGSVFVNLGGSIIAAAGDGIRVGDYGVGDVAVNLGYGASITATHSATASSNNAPYGIGAFNYGPGDIAVTMVGGDTITSGSSGIDAGNDATAISSTANALVAVSAAGTIDSGTTVNNSGSQPSGIVAGFLGGASATANLNVNGSVIVNNDANITAAAGWGIEAYNYGNGNVTVNDSSGTAIIGAEYGIAAYAESGGTGDVAININSGASIAGTSSYGIFAYNSDAGNISVITSSGDIINSGSAGIDAVNEAATIAASANSSIVVTAYGTITSGTGLTGSGNPPAGILAGYLGGSTNPTSFPLTSLNGNVVVNNFANINAASGDGIRAFNYGIGNITVNDEAGSIILGGSNSTNAYENGVSATNFGSGDIDVSTAAGIMINSINGGSGIVALNKAPAPWPGSTFSIPSTSDISVLAYGTIESGNIVLTGSGDPAAGILAGYNPDNTDTADSNIQGNVSIDDYASILAPAGTDGIRGINYGTGSITIAAEAGATITGGRYGIGALGYDGGDVSVTNYATVIGSTAAIDATTTSTGTVIIDNHGHLTGDVASYNSTFTNEVAAGWSLNGFSAFTGTSNLMNDGAIQSNGTSEISGLSSITNSGTIEVQSGSLKLDAGISGTGALTIDAGSTLELASGVSSGQTVTFSTTIGTLKLDSAQSFHGTVSDLGSVDGTQANSDQIDLANINRLSTSFSEMFNALTDVLTVTDGTNTANIQFAGTVGNLNFVPDGNNGTIVYDPPVTTSQSIGPVVMHDPGPPATSTIAATAPNQTLSGFAASDTFAFNFASVGQATVTDFHPTTDTLQFSSQLFANLQAALNATHDDGHGNTVIALDAHDTITLNGIIKAQLQASDFHFV